MYPDGHIIKELVLKQEQNSVTTHIFSIVWTNYGIKLKEWFINICTGEEYTNESLITDETQIEILKNMCKYA